MNTVVSKSGEQLPLTMVGTCCGAQDFLGKPAQWCVCVCRCNCRASSFLLCFCKQLLANFALTQYYQFLGFFFFIFPWSSSACWGCRLCGISGGTVRIPLTWKSLLSFQDLLCAPAQITWINPHQGHQGIARKNPASVPDFLCTGGVLLSVQQPECQKIGQTAQSDSTAIPTHAVLLCRSPRIFQDTLVSKARTSANQRTYWWLESSSS